MDYPRDFPEDLQGPVDSAIAQAEIEFSKAKNQAEYWSSEVAKRAIYRYVHAVFVAFAYQACKAFEEGAWNGERVRRALDSFRNDLIRRTYFEKHPNPSDYSHGDFWKSAARLIRESDDWPRIQAELKRVADERPSGNKGPKAAHSKNISERLDEIAILENISHEEQAHRIGISRAAYFAVKAGRGGKKVRKKTELYIDRLVPNT